MADLSLVVQKWNDSKNIIEVRDLCTSIKMHTSLKNITTELQFTIGYEYRNYYYYNFEIGDIVYFSLNGQQMFYGKITDSEFNLGSNTQIFTCYDLVWWVCKNNITKNFNGEMTIKEAIWYVFSLFDFRTFDVDVNELGKYADMKIGKHRIKNKPAKDVLLAIMSDVTRMTGIYYYLHMDFRGRVVITECDKYYSGLTIQQSSEDVADGNLIDYTVTRSMQDMVNRVIIYDSEYKELVPLYPENTLSARETNKNRYGIIQDTVVLSKDEDLEALIKEADEDEDIDGLTEKDQAKIAHSYNSKILKIKNQLQITGYPTTEVIVKCLGDVNYKVGYGVMAKLPDSEFYDKFMYITASEFDFIPNSDYWINTLTLSTSKHKELTTWADIEEVVVDKNGNIIQGEGSTIGNSMVVAKALEWAYKTANDNSIGYSQQNRWGDPDYDCSSFVISAYRYGGLSLAGATYTGNMYDTFLAEGFDDVTNEVNLATGEGLIAGDVLLNIIMHTEIYTGNGKKIGAHSSRLPKADQISENNYSNYPWNYVLRYAVTENEEEDDGGSSGNSGFVSNKYIELLKDLEGFTPTWDNSSKYGAIGYGTDASGNVGKRLKAEGVTICNKQQATEWLKEEVNYWAKQVRNKCADKGITLPQQYLDVMTDVCYQWGNQQWALLDLMAQAGNKSEVKSYILGLGYPRRDKARVNMLDGRYEIDE
ncbi:peptidoglycan amidohydrolase family protein [Clostridium butyricum]|uniref:XkdQ/YqbQ family protein n=1 Tax=Clostridium butyricum TaxID=1492 RepID=UPI003465F8EC